MLTEEFEALQGLRSGGALGLSKFSLLIRPLAPFPTCPLTVRFVIGCFLPLFLGVVKFSRTTIQNEIRYLVQLFSWTLNSQQSFTC